MAFLIATPVQHARATGADPDRHQRVDAILSPGIVGQAPGCAIGVAVDGRVDFTRGYGIADLAADVPITSQTVFHAASLSKQFTAFAIGLLEARGQLSYADPIRKFVPELPEATNAVTIDHLIHHTNGIREQGQLLNLAGWRGSDMYTEDDIMWALARQQQLNFVPGTEVVYSNAAYTLLGVVVRRLSGKTLRTFATDEIFVPLGMMDTRFSDSPTEIVRNRALSYLPGQNGVWSHAPLNIAHYGSTGLSTTVGDLLKWEQNLLDGRVGGSLLAIAMRTSGTLRDGTPIAYGHGLRLRGYRGLPMVSHDGADGGYRSEALLFPHQRLAVVALCNGATTDPGRIVRRIADLYLEKSMRRPELVPGVVVAAAAQSRLAGVYWSMQTDELVDLRWADGALRPAGAPGKLVPIGNDIFRPQDQPHEWRFGRARGGTRTLTVRDFWPTTRRFVRLTQPHPDMNTLAALAGRYRSDETDMTYTIIATPRGLRMAWSRGYDLRLDPVGGERFSSNRGTISFFRGNDGQVAGLTISNRRLRRLMAMRIELPIEGSHVP